MSIFQSTEVLVFLNVLLQQLGAPVPAVPTLIVSASLSGDARGILVLAVIATGASLLADWAWYVAGRLYGYKVLATLCRLSINPESCVSQTESRFRLWGPWSLVLAKFIPGFSTVAPPIAGAVRMPLLSFTLASALGAFLWAMAALLTGWLFEDEVNWLVNALRDNLLTVLVLSGLAFSGWLIWKISRRLAFQARLRMPKIQVDEVYEMIKRGDSTLRLIDLRPRLIQEDDPLRGWVHATPDTVVEMAQEWDQLDVLVTMCACPDDVSASHAADQLRQAGFHYAKALHGGFEAWQVFQHQVESSQK